jgi:hypothetical protein
VRRLPVLALLVAAACSKERSKESAPEPSVAPPAPEAAPSAAASQPPPAPPAPLATMKLLEAGQPPRRKLRYAWRADQKEQLAMDLRLSVATEAAGAKQPELPLPTVHIVIAIDPQSVSPEGDLRYAWRVTSAGVTADGQTPSQVGDGMRAEVAVIEHLTGTATVTSSGLAREVVIDAASVADAGTAGQMVEQVRQTLRDVAAPLPDEDVGKGARWQKTSQIDAKDARVAQTDTFTLVSLDASDKGKLEDVLAQTAPPQPLRAPGMPEGSRMRMDSMLASGGAKTSFDLSRLVPQTKFDGTTTMVVSGQTPGSGSERMTMVMRMGIVIAGTLR